LRIFKGGIDNHLVRASMVIVYFFFGYQKWFDYEARGLILRRSKLPARG
jgi:uncharacterized membrane protein YkgB